MRYWYGHRIGQRGWGGISFGPGSWLLLALLAPLILIGCIVYGIWLLPLAGRWRALLILAFVLFILWLPR